MDLVKTILLSDATMVVWSLSFCATVVGLVGFFWCIYRQTAANFGNIPYHKGILAEKKQWHFGIAFAGGFFLFLAIPVGLWFVTFHERNQLPS